MKKILKVIAPMFLLLGACNNNAKPETSTNTIGESTSTISTGTIDGPTSTISTGTIDGPTSDITSEFDTGDETEIGPSSYNDTTGTGTENDSSSTGEEEKSVTVSFDNVNGLTAGTNLTNSADKLTQFKDYFTSTTGHNWVDTIECQGPVVINEYGNSGNRTLCIGSGSSGGSINFHFDIDKTDNLYAKVEIDAQIYNKYDSYNGVWRIDAEAKLTVNGDEKEFDTPSGDCEPDHETITTYVTGRNLILKTNQANSRVLIHSMTFFYCE